MCPRGDPQFKDQAMTYDEFTNIFDKVPFVKELELTGLGEPLMHKDLFRMIEYAGKRKVRTVVTSNATLLDARNIQKVLDSGLDEIHISIDSADPEIFKTIRVGTTLEKVTTNLKNLVDARNRTGSKLRVVINSILMMRNYHQIGDMIKLCGAAGVNEISFSDMQYAFDVGISTKAESLRCASDAEKSEMKKIFDQAEGMAREFGIQIGLPRLDQPKVRTRCKQPWTMLVTDERGEVRPCCAIHFVSFGNLSQDRFNSIYNREKFENFREKLLSDEVPDKCKDCTFL
jgi:radical SAM protein with 4Fe4S-binding SPASM domain